MPAEQLVHWLSREAPDSVPYVPTGHTKHWLDEEAPADGPYVPALQLLH